MRSDMARVIVERPRGGARLNKLKGESRQSRSLPVDEWLQRDRMRGCYIRSKYLSEHLGPLRRFLYKNVGRPWDKVFAEICANISRNSAVQDHVRDHVFDFVEVHVILINGVPCSAAGAGYGRPLDADWYWKHLYVCPKTGLLRKIKQVKRKRRKREPEEQPRYVRFGKLQQCRLIRGNWYLVSLRRLPPPSYRLLSKARDVVLDRLVSALTSEQAAKAYGGEYFAVEKRLLNKRERKQFPVPLDGE